MSKLYTEADVRGLPRGTRLVLEARDIATPAALDEAYVRGITVVRASEVPTARGPASADPVWSRMLAADGSYVVQVERGRARVFRLTPEGPQPLGESGGK